MWPSCTHERRRAPCSHTCAHEDKAPPNQQRTSPLLYADSLNSTPAVVRALLQFLEDAAARGRAVVTGQRLRRGRLKQVVLYLSSSGRRNPCQQKKRATPQPDQPYLKTTSRPRRSNRRHRSKFRPHAAFYFAMATQGFRLSARCNGMENKSHMRR